TARAQSIAYNTLGPNDAYDGSAYILYGPQVGTGAWTQGFKFVSQATGGITTFVAMTQHLTSSPANTFLYELYTAAAGAPGTSLGTIGQLAGVSYNPLPAPPPIVTPGDGSISITAGTAYWLVGRSSGNGQGVIHANTLGVNGPRAYMAPFASGWQ